MKSQTLSGSSCFLHSQIVTLSYLSLSDPAILQAAASAMFSACVAGAELLGRVKSVTAPSIQLIGRQEETVSWFIGVVAIIEAFSDGKEDSEESETKTVPRELQSVADTAAALGGRVTMLPSRRAGNGFVLEQFPSNGMSNGASGNMHTADERNLLRELVSSGSSGDVSDAAGDVLPGIQAAEEKTIRVIKARRHTEEVHGGGDSRLWLPEVTEL